MNSLGLQLAWKRAMFAFVVALAVAQPAGLPAQSTEARKTYDLPADNADKALRRFSEQAGIQVLFPTEITRDVRTAAIKGNLTVREALDQMLAGTGLVAVQDSRTGALTVRREGPAEKNGASPVATGTIASGPTVRMEEIAVTGTRIRANSGEYPVQPLLTFSSLDIERTGAANLGQLFQYIPAVTSSTSGLGTELVNSTSSSGLGAGQTQSRTSAQLRGGSQTETLLLVDGRRVPLTGLRNAGGNGYDLGGIPLSAVERVEVLLDGASAIYGADAVNGVINVILKKRYAGTELRLNYDNTFDTDAAVKTASLTHGFAMGKWSGLLTLSASENTILLLEDRYLTRSFDRTLYGGITNQAQPTLYAEGTGSLNVASGNLPGTTTPRVSIPVNYAGGTVTVGDYAAAPAPVGGVTPGRQGATSHAKDRGAYFRLGYEFNEHVTVTASARVGRKEFRDNGTWRRVENVTIPAGYPGNPFGVPVRLSKTFYDLPPIVNGSDTSNDEFSITVGGGLPAGWRYETGVSFVQGTNNMAPPVLEGAGGQFGTQVAPAAQFTARLNAEIAAGRRPPLIYDSKTQSPNAARALDVFWVGTTQTKLNDRVRTWTYSAQADGRLFSLPAGEVKAVVGAEAREEYVAFPGSIGGQVWPVLPQRDVVSFYAETRIPVLGEKQKIPFFHRLDLNVAARTERYTDFGRATTPRYGAAWRPVRPVLFRASYGEGFLAPQLYRTAQQSAFVTLPASTVAIVFPGAVDLSRGNAPITSALNQLSGGNPDLKPQLSESLTFGMVVDVPRTKGLSVSFDYYDNQFTRAFGSISSIMDRQLFAPETIYRGDRLASDPAGWLGPITGYDGRTINISKSRTAGYSYGVRYLRRTVWGDFNVNVMGEKTLAREERILPNSALTATVNKRYVPERITASVFWTRDAWEGGITGVYGGQYWTDTNNAAIFPSRFTEDVTRYDASAVYDFGHRDRKGQSSGNAWWRRALKDTKVRVTVINLFNTEPPLTVNGAFSPSIIDIRLSRYVLDVTKRF
ncbi:MAG: TonB-dependent receptor [Opitutaceae bacterium]|nr:TonB-dependent receptor [Opitutaceae bacterium]